MLRPATSFLLLITLALMGPGLAQAAEHPWTFEVYGGKFFPENESEQDEEVFGVRFGRDLGQRWGVELSAGFIEFNPDDCANCADLDFWLIDLSAKYDLVRGGWGNVYALGGPGIFHIDFASDIFNERDDSFMLHAGLGAEFNFNERFYVRPELKQRWIDDEGLDDELNGELTVAFGFRY